jgi:predicted metalloprotease
MRWRGRRQSSNIEDRRGGGFSPGFGRGGMRIPIRAGGGGGIGFIIIVLVLWLGFGINPLQLLGEGGIDAGPASGPGVEGTPGETDDFVATVLADTESVWSARFE